MNKPLIARLCLVTAVLCPMTVAIANPLQAGSHGGDRVSDLLFEYRYLNDEDPERTASPIQLLLQSRDADLDQTIDQPGGLPPIRLVRYLPRARLDQQVVPVQDPTAGVALQISIEGPNLSYARWLIASDPARNRMTSYIAIWRYMSVIDQRQREELFNQFKVELTRPPKVLISRIGRDAVRELAASEGAVKTFEDLGCTVRVLKYWPHYSRDKEKNTTYSASDKRSNPAVEVEIQWRDNTDRRLLFARFPEYNVKQTDAMPFRVILDCPPDTPNPLPDFALVTVGKTGHEVWTRYHDQITSRSVLPDDKVDIPDSPYTFHIARFVPQAELVESYHPVGQDEDGVAALQIETMDVLGTPSTLWLRHGQAQTIETAKGPLELIFGRPRAGSAVMHGGRSENTVPTEDP